MKRFLFLLGSKTVESGNPLTMSFDGSPNNYYPTFAGNRRPNVVGTPSIRDGFRDTGGDRFNVQNINSVFSGRQNGLDNFTYPAAFTVGNLGRNTFTGLPLLWSQISAQKNLQITEKVRAQLRWDFRFEDLQLQPAHHHGRFPQSADLRQSVERPAHGVPGRPTADESHDGHLLSKHHGSPFGWVCDHTVAHAHLD